MPYQCTACNKRFRYKISQRTHKCSANPPGVVVRTNGYLVERLQAAMIKASVEVDKKPRQNEIEEKLISHSKVSSESTSFQSALSSSPQNNCIPPSGPESKKVESHLSKSGNPEKNCSEKPQIYLLVKGPNEETYYQPIVLSQNNNLIINQSNLAQPSQKDPVKTLDSKPIEKNITSDNQCTDFEMNINDVFMDSVNTNPDIHDKGGQSLPNTMIGEKVNDTAEIINEVNDSCHITKNCEENESSTNILSDEYEMNDIIRSLTSQFSEEQYCSEANIQKVDNAKTETNGDIVMVDSNDIFSLILSPSQSSPSERFGRLSLSPITSTQQALANPNFETSEVFPGNFSNSSDLHQDSLFDSINDDTLKELLFGSSK